MYAVRFGEFLFCPLWLYLVGGLWFGRVPHVWLLKPEKYRVSTGKILLLIDDTAKWICVGFSLNGAQGVTDTEGLCNFALPEMRWARAPFPRSFAPPAWGVQKSGRSSQRSRGRWRPGRPRSKGNRCYE